MAKALKANAVIQYTAIYTAVLFITHVLVLYILSLQCRMAAPLPGVMCLFEFALTFKSIITYFAFWTFVGLALGLYSAMRDRDRARHHDHLFLHNRVFIIVISVCVLILLVIGVGVYKSIQALG